MILDYAWCFPFKLSATLGFLPSQGQQVSSEWITNCVSPYLQYFCHLIFSTSLCYSFPVCFFVLDLKSPPEISVYCLMLSWLCVTVGQRVFFWKIVMSQYIILDIFTRWAVKEVLQLSINQQRQERKGVCINSWR